MIISKKYKFVFVHVHKTAGGSINEFFFKNYDCKLKSPAHVKMNYAKSKFKIDMSYFKFGFIRNPWDRMVSWYYHVTENKHRKMHLELYRVLIRQKDFEGFIKNVVTAKKSYGIGIIGYHWNCLDYMIEKPGSNKLNLMVDYVGKMETIQKDLDNICSKIGIESGQVPFVNKTNIRDRNYRKYYNSETEKIVRDIFKLDIEFGKYTF